MAKSDGKNPVGRPPTGRNRANQQTIFVSKDLVKALQTAGGRYHISGQAALDLIIENEFGTRPESLAVNVSQALTRAFEMIAQTPEPTEPDKHG